MKQVTNTCVDALKKLKSLYNENKTTAASLAALTTLYAARKIYCKWKYSQKILVTPAEKAKRVVLITGCSSGIGKAVALELSIGCGYKVIATCRRNESVKELNDNKQFTSNGSVSTQLDVTDNKQIENCKEFTIKYLNKTDSTLWGIVNNAGYAIDAAFELVPPDMAYHNINVLFFAPLRIIREFLPLLPGRMNYNNENYNYKINNGGRIVNISSVLAQLRVSSPLYGPAKAALSHVSHSLRMELSPRFGIWSCPVEPGGYRTNVIDNAQKQNQILYQRLQERKENELMEIYQFDVKKSNERLEKGKVEFNPSFDDVVNSVIHALTAKYPQTVYQPGWGVVLTICSLLPPFVLEWILTKPIKKDSKEK